MNEHLNASIRSKGIDGTDIYGIVSYIKYNKSNKDEMTQCIPLAKQWICEQLGYNKYILYSLNKQEKEKVEHNLWLKQFKKYRNKTIELKENIVYEESILNDFEMIPNIWWLKDGISINTQKEFEVGFDIKTERIIFAVRNKQGELIGVKGRYVGNDEEIKNRLKYLYLYPCNKSYELFNLHRALSHIQQKREVYIFEGAKSCLLAYEYGIYNCVSIEGDSLSEQQIKLLKNLGIDIKLTFCFDVDKDIKFIKEATEHINGRMVYAVYDKKEILGGKDTKHSIVDCGKDIFMELIKKYKYKIK